MANIKHLHLRKCVVSKQMLPKKELLRIVKTTNGEIIIDLTGKVYGRGIYLQPNLNIYKKAKKNYVLDRTLKVKLTDKFYETLYYKINEW